MEWLFRFKDEAWAADFVGKLSPCTLYAWIGPFVRVCLDGQDADEIERKARASCGRPAGKAAKEVARIEDLLAEMEGYREIYRPTKGKDDQAGTRIPRGESERGGVGDPENRCRQSHPGAR